MSYAGPVTLLMFAMGCASAGSGAAAGDDEPIVDDGGLVEDDAALPLDAMPMIDTPPPCVPTLTNLLVNGNFDGTPLGTGWTATPYQAGDALVTNTAPLVQSIPNVAWLGGIVSTVIGARASDVLYADIAIPASASTPLALTGFYELRTNETSAASVYDEVKVELVSAAGVVLETALAKTNLDKTTVYTALDKTFAATYAGQTVRLRMTSQNDFSLPTSFYFDTLALNSTICE